LRLQETEPKSLAIEVVSSHSKVSVSVDGTTVSRPRTAACPAKLDNLVRDGRTTMQYNSVVRSTTVIYITALIRLKNTGRFHCIFMCRFRNVSIAKISGFCGVTPCSPLKPNRCFRGTSRLNLHGIRVRKSRNQHEASRKQN
jgi:hypothetical protein